MARDNKGFACHKHTAMVSYEIHHVWPQCYHGPNTKGNKIKICPNAHSDIHHLMDRMLAGKPYDLHQYGNSVKFYAMAGYLAVLNYIQVELLGETARSADGDTMGEADIQRHGYPHA